MTGRPIQRRASACAAGVLLVVGALAGCSGDPRPPATPPPPPPGVSALDEAVAAMTSLRSYGFRLNATMTLSGALQRLGATGRVVNPDRIQAEVNLAGRTQQVVGVPEGQFVFGPDKKWQRAQNTSLQPIPWPRVLGNLVDPTISEATASGSTVTGAIAPADAATFGFPPDGALQTARAVVSLNAQHQVTKLDLTLTGTRGPTPVEVTEIVELDGFDRQAPVDVPRGVV